MSVPARLLDLESTADAHTAHLADIEDRLEPMRQHILALEAALAAHTANHDSAPVPLTPWQAPQIVYSHVGGTPLVPGGADMHVQLGAAAPLTSEDAHASS